MSELELVVVGKSIEYQGIFRADDVFRVINRALEEKGYDKAEKRLEETVTPEGRKLYMELRPSKGKTDYLVLALRVKIWLDDVTEVMQEFEGRAQKFERGKARITIDSYYDTDNMGRWNKKPFFYFVKALINKIFYQFPEEPKAKGELRGDTGYVHGQLKKLFASYRKRDIAFPAEADIRSQVAQDLAGVGEVSEQEVVKQGA